MPESSRSREKESRKKELWIKTFISSVFLGGFGLFVAWVLLYGPGFDIFRLSTLDIVLLGLATYRLGHLLSYDRVMEPLRSFFTETVPDPTGEGESVDPKGEGFQQVIGQLLCCPICTGTWVAALMVYSMYLWPGPARVFVTIMAVVGIAEFLNAASELFSWGGQYARTASGAIRKSQRDLDPIDATRPESLPIDDSIFSRRVKK